MKSCLQVHARFTRMSWRAACGCRSFANVSLTVSFEKRFLGKPVRPFEHFQLFRRESRLNKKPYTKIHNIPTDCLKSCLAEWRKMYLGVTKVWDTSRHFLLQFRFPDIAVKEIAFPHLFGLVRRSLVGFEMFTGSFQFLKHSVRRKPQAKVCEGATATCGPPGHPCETCMHLKARIIFRIPRKREMTEMRERIQIQGG